MGGDSKGAEELGENSRRRHNVATKTSMREIGWVFRGGKLLQLEIWRGTITICTVVRFFKFQIIFFDKYF